MGLIRLQNVTKQFGDRVVLDDVSLELHTNQTVGLIGANGSGKTTILRLIAGLLTPDTGSVTISRGLDVGYLPQEPVAAGDLTLHDEVLSAFADVLALEQKLHALSEKMAAQPPGPALDDLMAQYDRTNARFEAAGGYSFEQRLGEILGGLGFQAADYQLPVSVLSGGQKCRAALAKLLLRDAQFLLLDEPTNHLDIDAVRWLEKFLAGHHGGAVIISHDRYLLDRLADRIVEVAGSHTRSFPGNYSNYVHTREVRDLTQRRQFQQDKAFIEKERAFIAKHMGKQRTAEAKGRLARLERRLKAGEFTLERPEHQERVHLRFGKDADRLRTGRPVLDVQALSKRYDEKVLFENLTFDVGPGQRFGITGPNGTGKTTLLRIVLGQTPSDTGEFHFAPQAAVGYYAQETTELDPDHSIVQSILATRPDMLESQARNFAARFLFRGEDAFKLVGNLSGGEQSRVRLMKIILSSPNVLILDEPTNHLDIPSREALEDALTEFPGTIIAVSHDRYFLDRLCERLLVIRHAEHTLYDGNYSFYIGRVEQQRAAAEAAAAEKQPPTKGKAARQARAAQATGPVSRLAHLKLDQLEDLIMKLEVDVMHLQERFGDPALYHDVEALDELKDEFEEKKTDLAEAEDEWNRRAEKE
ncbi:MAG: ABC-F family ATP-binding cassette domain-containing protein [Phycisphaerae bacterium]|jgi:ATP-binding cassette subfamily F protein 3